MKKNKIDFKNFEIIKVGQSQIRGGVTVGSGSGSRPATTEDPKNLGKILPCACDNAG